MTWEIWTLIILGLIILIGLIIFFIVRNNRNKHLKQERMIFGSNDPREIPGSYDQGEISGKQFQRTSTKISTLPDD